MYRSQKTEHYGHIPEEAAGSVYSGKIRLKVRFDCKGIPRPPRFFFGGKNSREVAEELREQQATLWRNAPIQGVHVEDVEYLDMYTVFDRVEGLDIVYAPLTLLITVDSIEDCLRFVSRDEFKRVEILEPPSLSVNSLELERLLYRFSETLQQRLRESVAR